MRKKVIFLLLLLFAIHFWGFTFIPPSLDNYTNFLSLLVMGVCFFGSLKKESLQFRNAIIVYIIGIILNIVSCYINHGQNPVHTLISFGSFYFILFYFLLHELRVNWKYLETIILLFALIYSFLYIIQLVLYPFPLFDNEMVVDRGTIRLRIEGNGFLMLAYFLSLSRYLLKRRLVNLFLSLGFFVILFIGGFRTLTVAAVLLSGLMAVRLLQLSIKSFALFSFFILLFVGLFQIQGVSKIFNEMINTSKSQLEDSDEDIRLLQLEYFFTRFPVNKSVYLLGSGLPNSDKSSYARSMLYLESKGFYWVDIGLLGFYIIIGPVALIGLLWYTIKAIATKLPRDRLYLNIYFMYLLLTSFTTMEIFRPGIFVVQAIVLYLIDISLQEKGLFLKEATSLFVLDEDTPMKLQES